MTPLTVFLAPGSINHIANIVKGYAIAIGVVVAIGFVWTWWKHRQRERQQELSARAAGLFSAHLRSALAYPELAEPVLGALSSPADLVRYRTFVAALVATCDEILMLDASAHRQDGVLRLLAPHASYLKSQEFRATSRMDCSPTLQALIDRLAQG